MARARCRAPASGLRHDEMHNRDGSPGPGQALQTAATNAAAIKQRVFLWSPPSVSVEAT